MVDRRIRALVLGTISCIRIFSPKHSTYYAEMQKAFFVNMPKDILVKVICRYTNLKEIIFGRRSDWLGDIKFGAYEEPYLKSLISCLESDPNKHLLSSVKKIQYWEIIQDRSGAFNEKEAKNLNNLFLNSIGHKDLERVKIKSLYISLLTGTAIQPLLTKSPNLRTFAFNGYKSNLSFADQPQLTKVKLFNCNISTIKSLENCKELKELIIDFKSSFFDLQPHSPDDIKAVLLKNPWNLKHLELINFQLQNDELSAITKNLPALECLSVQSHNISDEGLEQLGKNCLNLKILQFINKNLTDSGLDKLTQNLPLLELISLEKASNITGAGIAAIACNCKNLRAIQIFYYTKITKENMDQLVENLPKLRYINVLVIEKIYAGQLPNFYQKFPQIRTFSEIDNVKKLHKLTI